MTPRHLIQVMQSLVGRLAHTPHGSHQAGQMLIDKLQDLDEEIRVEQERDEEAFSFELEIRSNRLDSSQDDQSQSMGNEVSIEFLDRIQSQIERIKSQSRSETKSFQDKEEAEMSIEQETTHKSSLLLHLAVKKWACHSMEKNLDEWLNGMNDAEKAQTLASSIKSLEEEEQVNSGSISNGVQQVFHVFLELFSKIEPQIIAEHPETEYRLLFEKRPSYPSTQPFLLSLLVHQARWPKLMTNVRQLLRPSLSFRLLNSFQLIVIHF